MSHGPDLTLVRSAAAAPPPREFSPDAIEHAKNLIRAIVDAPSAAEASRRWVPFVAHVAACGDDRVEYVQCAIQELRGENVIGLSEHAYLTRELYALSGGPGPRSVPRNVIEFRSSARRIPSGVAVQRCGGHLPWDLHAISARGYQDICEAGRFSLRILKPDLGGAVTEPDGLLVPDMRSHLIDWAALPRRGTLPWGPCGTWHLTAGEIASWRLVVQQAWAKGVFKREVAAALIDALADETLSLAFTHDPMWVRIRDLSPDLGCDDDDRQDAWSVLAPELARFNHRAQLIKAGWLRRVGEGWMAGLLFDRPVEYLAMIRLARRGE